MSNDQGEGEPAARMDGFHFDKTIARMAFDAMLTIAVAAVGFMVSRGVEEIRDLRARADTAETSMAVMRERLPLEYVRIEAYVRDRQEMMTLLRDIDRNVREHRENVANGRALPSR